MSLLLLPQTPPPTAMNRTTGKVKRELLIKVPSPERRTTLVEAIFSCLITKWAFLKRQAMTLTSLKWHSLSNVPVTAATAAALNPSLLLINEKDDLPLL